MLVSWYLTHKRAMPWRDNPQPYYIWVSEVMLQQTQVATVIPYFERFIHQFPTLNDLASADQQHVLKAWEGLGYYSRARNFHRGAQYVMTHYGGKIPETYSELQKLPSLGPYCAAAIASIAFNQPVPVVDGNVLRVFARFWGIEEDISLTSLRKKLFDQLHPFVKQTLPADFNQGIMELGALICKPQQPKCTQCPIITCCWAYQHKAVDRLPIKSKAIAVPHYHVAVGLVWQNNRFLITRRSENKMLGGMWDLPGGKQENSESLGTTVQREIHIKTGLTITTDHEYGTIRHTYSHFSINLHGFACNQISGNIKLLSKDYQWVSFAETTQLPIAGATQKLLKMIDRTES